MKNQTNVTNNVQNHVTHLQSFLVRDPKHVGFELNLVLLLCGEDVEFEEL